MHGGAHGGWCYGRVARVLRSAGHDVYTPTLTGVGERSHLVRADIDLDLHIRDILAVLHYEDLHDVVLVGHSYGGMVITGVADRDPGRVGHLVYLDAAMPANGESLADIAAPLMEAARRDMPRGGRRRARVVPRDRADAQLRGRERRRRGLDGGEAHAASVEVLHPTAAALERGGVGADPPERHLLHLDASFPRPGAARTRARAAGRLWDVDTGHDLMISEPDAVAELLLRAAGAPTDAGYRAHDESRA